VPVAAPESAVTVLHSCQLIEEVYAGPACPPANFDSFVLPHCPDLGCMNRRLTELLLRNHAHRVGYAATGLAVIWARRLSRPPGSTRFRSPATLAVKARWQSSGIESASAYQDCAPSRRGILGRPRLWISEDLGCRASG
jgi:hypothetical protein